MKRIKPIREIQTDNRREFTSALFSVETKHKTLFESALEQTDILCHRNRTATPRHNDKRRETESHRHPAFLFSPKDV